MVIDAHDQDDRKGNGINATNKHAQTPFPGPSRRRVELQLVLLALSLPFSAQSRHSAILDPAFTLRAIISVSPFVSISGVDYLSPSLVSFTLLNYGTIDPSTTLNIGYTNNTAFYKGTVTNLASQVNLGNYNLVQGVWL